MGQGAPKAALAILRRILAYARKVLKWEDHLDAVGDARPRPQIPGRTIVRAVVVLFLSRRGSLNALEQTKPSRFWPRWLGGELPSADSLGRICALMVVADLRALFHHVYSRLKRMKALEPPGHGLMLAVVDGHETTASRKRCCPECAQRVVHTLGGDIVEYYHRYAVLRLVGQHVSWMMDAEPVRPGEDELATARRLVERVLETYPRAFEVVAGDALYANTEWFRFLLTRGKHALAVLKDNRPHLLDDARTLFRALPPSVVGSAGNLQWQYWDSDQLTSWPELAPQVRVVRSLETRTVRRQLDRRAEALTSDWLWVTTLPKAMATTPTVVDLGHDRWTIENQGFNELVNRWHADHVYKHHPTALLVFFLFALLGLNVFLAFYRRNLQPAVRHTSSMLHVGELIAAELYAGIRQGPARAPG
ncbi:MAG: transposase [Planctomycetota bacterium]